MIRSASSFVVRTVGISGEISFYNFILPKRIDKIMSSIHKQVTLNDIATNWYYVVKEKENAGELSLPVSSDDAFRFMTYWMAFNSLYSEIYKIRFERDQSTISNLKNKYSYTPQSDALFNGKDNIICINRLDKDEWFNTNKEYPNVRENTQIILYTDTIIQNLQKKFDFNYYIENCNELAKQPISSGSTGKSYKEFIERFPQRLCERDKRNLFYYCSIFIDNSAPFRIKMMSLILTIYQIRCNLFHGQKDPTIDRDLALISEAASVMEKILFVILEVDEPSKIPYNTINQKIDSFDINSCKTKKQWSDAQLIITDQDINSVLRSLNSNTNNLEIVSTPYSKCLIWLLGQMKPFAKIDYISKYEYYKTIGNTAKDFLSSNANGIELNPNYFIKNMMIEVLNSVSDYL